MATKLDKSSVLETASEFLTLAKERDAGTYAKPIEEMQKEIEKEFNLVVVGEIKKGKSSLINAFLDEPLLPVDVHVATSTVFEVRYADTRTCEVVFLPEDASRPEEARSSVISFEEVPAYGTADGNPGNEKRVDRIRIGIPHPFLKSGLTIVDTPGLGGLFKEHADITWKCAIEADAICFVLDSVGRVASAPEMKSLKDFWEIAKKIGMPKPPLFFVQTKEDAVPQAEADDFRARNLEIISEHLSIAPADIPYFLTSSILKRSADTRDESGFPELCRFIEQELLGVREEKVARELLMSVQDITETVLQPGIRDELALFQNAQAEELNRLNEENRKFREGLKEWQSKTYPETLNKTDLAVRDCARDAVAELQKTFTGNEASPIVSPIVDDLRKWEVRAKLIQTEADNVARKCGDACQDAAFKILTHYHGRLDEVTTQEFEKLGASLEAMSPTVEENRRQYPKISFVSMSGYEKFRATVGDAWIPIILFAKIPIVGPALAAIGAGVALIFGNRSRQKHERENTLAQLRKTLHDIEVETLRHCTIQVQSVLDHCLANLKDAARGAVEDMEKALERKQAAVNAARTQNRAENKPRVDALTAQLKRVKNLLDKIKGMLGSDIHAASARN